MRLLAGISNIMKNGVRKVHFLDGLTMHKRGIEKIENGYFDNKVIWVEIYLKYKSFSDSAYLLFLQLVPFVQVIYSQT